MKLLNYTARAQFSLVALWTLLVLLTPENLSSSLRIEFVLVPVCIASGLIALWHAVREPASRKQAIFVIATPWCGYALVAATSVVYGLPHTGMALLSAALFGLTIDLLTRGQIGSDAGGNGQFLRHPDLNRRLLHTLLALIAIWLLTTATMLALVGMAGVSVTSTWTVVGLLVASAISASVAIPSFVYATSQLLRGGAVQPRIHAGQMAASLGLFVFLAPATANLMILLTIPG